MDIVDTLIFFLLSVMFSLFLPSLLIISIQHGKLGIEGYTLYRGDHSSGSGGLGKGVGVYVNNSLNHSAPDFRKVGLATYLLVRLILGMYNPRN